MSFRISSIIYFLVMVSSLFSQNEFPSSLNHFNEVNWIKQLKNQRKTLSLEEIQQLLEIQQNAKQLYLDLIEQQMDLKKLKGLAHTQAAQKQKNLKGGMMLLSGVLSVAMGGVSFYLSEKYYDKYEAAELTADAIEYRRATQAFDALKFILMGAGIGIAAGSSYYFAQAPNAVEVAQMENHQIHLKEWFFAR